MSMSILKNNKNNKINKIKIINNWNNKKLYYFD